MKDSKVTLIKLFIGLVVAIPLVQLMELVLATLTSSAYINDYTGFMLYAMLVSAYVTVLFWKKLYEYAHRYVFVLIILMGLVQIIGTPPVAGISWDDEIHYKRTAHVSWGADGKIAPADLEVYNHYQTVIYERKEYTKEGREVWENYINQYHEDNKQLVQKEFEFNQKSVAYLPGALGLAIGHLFDMSFIHTFMLGKFFSLLCYAIFVSLAIKSIGKGKIILAVIAMLPTNIFLAASYSYDWWVTSLVMLGYALFIQDIQLGRKITVKKMLLIQIIMVIAMLPKAVYFPLLFPMMMWKDDRYENPKICRLLVVVGMAVLFASFLLPMLIGGAGTGDERGGTGVNSTEQIKFILTSPFSYLVILVKFLFDFLSPDTVPQYASFYAYMGAGSFYTIALPFIAGACVLDNDVHGLEKKENIWVRASSFLGVVGSLVLVVTALYISFTAVASPIVAGCQPRYILPILFPGLYFLTGMRIDMPEKIKRNAFNIMMSVLAFVFFYNMFELCIAKY